VIRGRQVIGEDPVFGMRYSVISNPTHEPVHVSILEPEPEPEPESEPGLLAHNSLSFRLRFSNYDQTSRHGKPITNLPGLSL
jgi:hypothetical protein